MRDTILNIEGMHCDGCARRLKTVLEREPGVREAQVSFAERRARIRFRPHGVEDSRLAQVIETAGFTLAGREA
jgi:copper chaperone